MTYRYAYEALRAAFLRPGAKYPDAEALAEDCAEIALEALSDIVSEEELDGIATGDIALGTLTCVPIVM